MNSAISPRNDLERFQEIVEKGRNGKEILSKDEIICLLSASSEDERQLLYDAADEVRKKIVGDPVHLRGIIEFSNYCRQNCHYCGLRRDNPKLPRYRMSLDEIFEVAKGASKIGYKTFVLQSGEDPWYTGEMIADLVRRIKKELGTAITLSLGERETSEYALWREAGADRYLLKHETTDEELFQKLRPGTTFQHRLNCLETLKKLGYQVGSGFIIGLPGQTLETLANDILLLRDLEVDMAGMGPLIPNPATPLADCNLGSVEMTLNCIAVARLVVREVHLPATTALATRDPWGRQKGLRAGGNVIMPDVTPPSFRKRYEIYPGKICLEDEPAHCRICVTGLIESIGRHVAEDAGDSPRLRKMD